MSDDEGMYTNPRVVIASAKRVAIQGPQAGFFCGSWQIIKDSDYDLVCGSWIPTRFALAMTAEKLAIASESPQLIEKLLKSYTSKTTLKNPSQIKIQS